MPEETTPAQEPTPTATPPTTTGPTTSAAEPEREARTPDMPEYKGEPLDAERGPGLGCFWVQIALLTFFLVFTPLTVTWGWDSRISGVLLIITLILLLFSGQTIIFLLRLVAADRRTRRTPLDPGAKPTVGQMEDAGPRPAVAPETKATPETKAAPTEAEPDAKPGSSEAKDEDG